MPSARRYPRTSAAAFMFVCLGSSTARAQSASDEATAQALFDDAQKLASSNDWQSACPKYAESNRLDPGIGVKLYLGDCYEHLGKTASAWAMFGEAEEYARKAGDSRVTVAHERAEKLAPRLSRLAVMVTGTVPGLSVRRDGQDVGAAQWGLPLPVDPGSHSIEVAAPGKLPWTSSVDAREGDNLVVQVPRLADAPSAREAVPATSREAAHYGPKTQRVLALVTGGIGLVGVGVGSVFGLIAKSNLDASNDRHCRSGNLCDETGVQLRSDALSDALVSTIGFVAGGAGLAGGLVLWLTAPSDSVNDSVTVRISPQASLHSVGLRCGGTF